MITASHPYQLTIDDNNKLNWYFPNILLADSNINEPLSHGYIAYRIRPKATVKIGDTIRNTAAIYFDFNPPVVTNISATAIMSTMILPAYLKVFRAELKGSVVHVSWQTATETNSDHFEVQRSTNGKDFVTIGKVQAKNLAQGAQYAFIDASPVCGIQLLPVKCCGPEPDQQAIIHCTGQCKITRTWWPLFIPILRVAK